jgi:hypothetical protein
MDVAITQATSAIKVLDTRDCRQRVSPKKMSNHFSEKELGGKRR